MNYERTELSIDIDNAILPTVNLLDAVQTGILGNHKADGFAETMMLVSPRATLTHHICTQLARDELLNELCNNRHVNPTYSPFIKGVVVISIARMMWRTIYRAITYNGKLDYFKKHEEIKVIQAGLCSHDFHREKFLEWLTHSKVLRTDDPFSVHNGYELPDGISFGEASEALEDILMYFMDEYLTQELRPHLPISKLLGNDGKETIRSVSTEIIQSTADLNPFYDERFAMWSRNGYRTLLQEVVENAQ